MAKESEKIISSLADRERTIVRISAMYPDYSVQIVPDIGQSDLV